MNKTIADAKSAKGTDKYKYAAEEIKNEFDKALENAIKAVENPVSQGNVDRLAKDLKENTEKLDGVKPENPEEEVTKVTDEKTKISVTGKNLSGKELVVEKIDANQIPSLKGKNVSLFDISFRDAVTKEKVNLPVGHYVVEIPKEKGKIADQLYYVADDGKLEALTFVHNDGYIKFVANHFSKYAVEYRAEKPEDNNKLGNDNNKPGNNEKPDNRTARKPKLAKTGIAQISLLPTILLGIASVVISKKRR